MIYFRDVFDIHSSTLTGVPINNRILIEIKFCILLAKYSIRRRFNIIERRHHENATET